MFIRITCPLLYKLRRCLKRTAVCVSDLNETIRKMQLPRDTSKYAMSQECSIQDCRSVGSGNESKSKGQCKHFICEYCLYAMTGGKGYCNWNEQFYYCEALDDNNNACDAKVIRSSCFELRIFTMRY